MLNHHFSLLCVFPIEVDLLRQFLCPHVGVPLLFPAMYMIVHIIHNTFIHPFLLSCRPPQSIQVHLDGKCLAGSCVVRPLKVGNEDIVYR